MALGFALVTFSLLFIASGIRKQSVLDTLKGLAPPSEPTSASVDASLRSNAAATSPSGVAAAGGGDPTANAIGPTAGVGHFDGKPVANWLIPYLKWARQHGWSGRLESGYRTPAYSESLCFDMCGAPTCSGKCAGKGSHHSQTVKPKGAIDVTNAAQFGQVIARCPFSPKIFNALPSDQVHFSATGN